MTYLNANQTKLGAATVDATRVWLKNAVKLSNQSPETKKVFESAIELIMLSAEYIVICAEKGKTPSKKDAAVYIGKKLVIFGSLSNSEQLACVASIVDVGFNLSATGTMVFTTASTAGLATPAMLLASLSLVVSCMDMVEVCKPVVKNFLREAERAARIRNIYEQNMRMYLFELQSKAHRTA